MRRSLRLSVAVSATAAMILAACGTSGDGQSGTSPGGSNGGTGTNGDNGGDDGEPVDPEWQQIIDAAREEGELLIYGSFSQSLQDAYIPAFQEKYPFIDVQVIYGTGPESAERIRAEVAGNQLQADIWRSATDPALEMRNQGLLEQWLAPSLANEPELFPFGPGDYDEQGYLNNVSVGVFGIAVNTNLLAEADWPTSWFDLADPKYRSQIIFSDPRRPSPGRSLSWFITQEYGEEGEDFLNAMAEQQLQFEANSAKMAEDLARGERAITAPLLWTEFQAISGANVAFIQPDEGLYYAMYNAVIIDGAPHPNAAKLWIEWEVSHEGQQLKAEIGEESAIRTDVEAAETWLRMDTAEPWAAVPFEDRLTRRDEMGETIARFFE